MKDLSVNGRTVPLEIRVRGVRHIYLRVLPDLRLEVVMPRRAKMGLEEVIARKRRWIEKKVAEMAEARRLLTEHTVFYRGEPFQVVSMAANGRRPGVVLSGNTAAVHLRTGASAGNALRRFLTEETRRYVEERVHDLSQDTGLSCNSIAVREMRKWGYCTVKGKLCFNWRLACLPPRLADYVILHEVLHLKHFDHSQRFKSTLAKHLPAYRDMEIALRGYLTD